MLKFLILGILLIIFELPFMFKLKQAVDNFSITRQVAIVVIMLLILCAFVGIYKLTDFLW